MGATSKTIPAPSALEASVTVQEVSSLAPSPLPNDASNDLAPVISFNDGNPVDAPLAPRTRIIKIAIAPQTPVAEPAITLQMPTAEETIARQSPVTEPTIATRMTVMEPTIATQMPVVEPTIATQMPVTEPTIATQMPVAEPTDATQTPTEDTTVNPSPPIKDATITTPPSDPVTRALTPEIDADIIARSKLGDAARSLMPFRADGNGQKKKELYHAAFNSAVSRVQEILVELSELTNMKYEKVEADMFACMTLPKHTRIARAWDAYVTNVMNERANGTFQVSSSRITHSSIENDTTQSRIHVQCDPDVQAAYAKLTDAEKQALVADATEIRDAKTKVVKYGLARTISATYQTDHIHAEVWTPCAV
jgi:hypothetical protein